MSLNRVRDPEDPGQHAGSAAAAGTGVDPCDVTAEFHRGLVNQSVIGGLSKNVLLDRSIDRSKWISTPLTALKPQRCMCPSWQRDQRLSTSGFHINIPREALCFGTAANSKNSEELEWKRRHLNLNEKCCLCSFHHK